MRRSAAISLNERSAAIGLQRQVGKAVRRRLVLQDSKSPYRAFHQIANLRQGAVCAPGAVRSGAGVISVDRNNNHIKPPTATSSIYRKAPQMTLPKWDIKVSDIEAVILARSVKDTARQTGLSATAIKKWRVTGLPASFKLALKMILTDPELWAQTKRARMLLQADEIDQQIAELQALRGAMNDVVEDNPGHTLALVRRALQSRGKGDSGAEE
jgi:hypothetical protein